PDYLATLESIKQLELDTSVAKNNRLPTLDLGGSVGYNGIDNSYRGAVDAVPNGDARSWQLDLRLSVPWGLRADRARYRASVANPRQQEMRAQRIDQDLLLQVRAAARAVETNQESVEINRNAAALASRQYELEHARFKAGLSTRRQVLQILDDLETTRVNELL